MVIVGVLCLLLLGCTRAYTGKSMTEFTRDVGQCAMTAEYEFTQATDADVFLVHPAPSNAERLDTCLQARGWSPR